MFCSNCSQMTGNSFTESDYSIMIMTNFTLSYKLTVIILLRRFLNQTCLFNVKGGIALVKSGLGLDSNDRIAFYSVHGAMIRHNQLTGKCLPLSLDHTPQTETLSTGSEGAWSNIA
ncbi:hypothetical protein CEXT_622131 [Caerostris extrusa]|uniref:PPM-type phosphatase domain-containing protein n=1 Tax=Caerostris extrusa TaxID=172846 RepID=A0AAV4W7G7_CAEEX|nr:hypothetical protein CEXT_622131 [Caerostris extrusa]